MRLIFASATGPQLECEPLFGAAPRPHACPFGARRATSREIRRVCLTPGLIDTRRNNPTRHCGANRPQHPRPSVRASPFPCAAPAFSLFLRRLWHWPTYIVFFWDALPARLPIKASSAGLCGVDRRLPADQFLIEGASLWRCVEATFPPSQCFLWYWPTQLGRLLYVWLARLPI